MQALVGVGIWMVLCLCQTAVADQKIMEDRTTTAVTVFADDPTSGPPGSMQTVTSRKTQAHTPWPEAAKLSYIDRCAESMSSQGLAQKVATRYCICVADGMSTEFGMEQYDQMMKAQPNQKWIGHRSSSVRGIFWLQLDTSALMKS